MTFPITFLGLSGLINFITCISIATFVVLKNIKNPLNISFFNLNASVALFSLGYFFWQMSSSEKLAFFWFKVLFVGIVLINITYLYFVFHFLGLIERQHKLLRILAVLNFIFIVLNSSSLLYAKVEPRYGLGFWPKPTALFHLYLLFWFFQCFYGFYWLLKSLKNSIGVRKAQIKYFTISAMFGFAGGATNWPMWYGINFPPYLNITISLYISIVAYAIFRYRLIDINVALTRVGIFIIVYAIVLGIPFWLGYATKSWFISTSFAVILATLGPFIYQALRQRAEDLILKEQRRYQRALRELAKTMIRIRDLEQLIQVVSQTIVSSVKVSFSAIYLKDDEHRGYQLKSYFPKVSGERFKDFIPFEYPFTQRLFSEKRPLLSEELGSQDKIRLESGLVIPCLIEDELLGLIVIGAKSSHELYTPDDVLVFETLSYSMSLAIENCIFWKEIEDRQRKARLQEMDTYSYSLAHEIDNPMQVILGQAGLLQKEFLKECTDELKRKDLNDSFEFILEAARRVSGMVKAIRDFGQPTTGEFKPIKIEEVVDSFHKLYFPQFKANSIVFEKDVPAGLGFVRGEKPELMQVLVILANNSLHAMKHAQEKRMFLKAESSNHDRVKISISDSGYGIKKELLPVIFAPFTTTKASSEGTGMGLRNAKKIVERHKGRIWAESSGEHKGATFFIELPLAKDVKEGGAGQDDLGRKRLL